MKHAFELLKLAQTVCLPPCNASFTLSNGQLMLTLFYDKGKGLGPMFYSFKFDEFDFHVSVDYLWRGIQGLMYEDDAAVPNEENQ